MINTESVDLDALAETYRGKIDEARRLEEQFKHEEHGIRWRDYYAGRADGLAEALSAIEWPNVSASSPSVNAELPAVRSTAWLGPLIESWERRHNQYDAAPKVPEQCRAAELRLCLAELRACAESGPNVVFSDGGEKVKPKE